MGCCDKIIDASKMITPCECKPEAFPFACPVHGGCVKSDHYVHLCRTNIDYHNGWKTGKSPCMTPDGWQPPPKAFGLGDAVAWLIRVVTLGRVKPCISCKSRIAWLNSKLTLWRRRR